MDKHKMHFGISENLCRHRGRNRTNHVADVTCQHCIQEPVEGRYGL